MAAIQGEEDASYLSMTKGKMLFFPFNVLGFYLFNMPRLNYVMGR
jgi:hypothetical protein